MSVTPTPPPTSPKPPPAPSLGQVFDWKLLLALGLLVGFGVVSCDLVNRALDRVGSAQPPAPDPAQWQPETRTRLTFALDTLDAERHACASDQEFGTTRCEFRAKKLRFPRATDQPIDDDKQHVLQPYLTAVGEHPVLVAGVWHTPEVAFRRHLEPPRSRKPEELQPFYVECEVEFVGRMETFEARYAFNQKWQAGAPTAAGVASWCTILRGDPNPG